MSLTPPERVGRRKGPLEQVGLSLKPPERVGWSRLRVVIGACEFGAPGAGWQQKRKPLEQVGGSRLKVVVGGEFDAPGASWRMKKNPWSRLA